MDEITTSSAISNAHGKVLDVYTSTGEPRTRVKVTEQSATTLTVRDLRWYETTWLWITLGWRRVLRSITEWIRSL